jgi:hypothetical protein
LCANFGKYAILKKIEQRKTAAVAAPKGGKYHAKYAKAAGHADAERI